MSIHEDLKAFVDGELSAEREAEVRAAIERDPKLQHEIKLLRTLSEQVRALASEPIPIGAEAALRRLRKPTFAESLVRIPVTWAAAATLVLATLGLFAVPLMQDAPSAARNVINASFRTDAPTLGASADLTRERSKNVDKPRLQVKKDEARSTNAGVPAAAKGSGGAGSISNSPSTPNLDGGAREELGPHEALAPNGTRMELTPPTTYKVQVPNALYAQSQAADYLKDIGANVQKSKPQVSRTGKIAEVTAQVPEYVAKKAVSYVVSASQGQQPIAAELDDNKTEQKAKEVRADEEQVSLSFVFEEQQTQLQRGGPSRSGTINGIGRSRANSGFGVPASYFVWIPAILPILLFLGWLGLRLRVRP